MKIVRIIDGIEEARNVQDYKIVLSSNLKEPDQRLTLVFKRFRQHGIKLNQSKCVFRYRPDLLRTQTRPFQDRSNFKNVQP